MGGGPIDEANKSLSEHSCSSSKYETFLRSRPKEAENEAIALVIRLCREYRVRCHIVHLSSSDAVAMLRAAKEEGLPITAEKMSGTVKRTFLRGQLIYQTNVDCAPSTGPLG